jgi:F-type H+-transporting ATPase subunit a
VPEHSTWLTLLLGLMEGLKENLQENSRFVGNSFILNQPASWHSFEPVIASALVSVGLLFVARGLRFRMEDLDSAVIPDEKLTLMSATETFLGYFYDMAKSVMDPVRAKKYFPVIGASALFVFLSNVLALLPGMPVPTSNLSVTAGCALVVFVLFNIYGLMTHGWDYVKHLMGPAWYLAPLVFVIEVISLCVRPITLAVRLMLNMSVDHLILMILMGLATLALPIPVMLLGCLVILVQTLVFALLTCVYIGLATEHEAH